MQYTAYHKQVYESANNQAFISKHYQLCQVRVLTHQTVNHLSEDPEREGLVHSVADHTASISSLFTHSNNGKYEGPSTAAVDQELDTL